ncbi:hypothetical protein RFI_25169, partial [Reticulomyxa filosa]
NRFRKQRIPRNLMLYKKATKQLRRKSQIEKHQHMIKALIPCMKEHKKFIHEIQGIKHQQYIHLQPPKDVDKKHYEMVEDEIKFNYAISKPLELDDNYVCSFDIHQSDITR